MDKEFEEKIRQIAKEEAIDVVHWVFTELGRKTEKILKLVGEEEPLDISIEERDTKAIIKDVRTIKDQIEEIKNYLPVLEARAKELGVL